jgi:hypothetical protein
MILSKQTLQRKMRMVASKPVVNSLPRMVAKITGVPHLPYKKKLIRKILKSLRAMMI